VGNLANQAAGAPLGQAAPYLYQLKGSAIYDVTDVTSPFNVADVMFDPPNASVFESANALAAPLGRHDKLRQCVVRKRLFDSLGCVHLRHRFLPEDGSGMG
jgi:hypothetical protein